MLTLGIYTPVVVGELYTSWRRILLLVLFNIGILRHYMPVIVHLGGMFTAITRCAIIFHLACIFLIKYLQMSIFCCTFAAKNSVYD